MKKLSWSLFSILILLSLTNLSVSAEKTIKGKPKVLDGDTIRIGNEKIRFSGIDSPESYYRGKKQTNSLMNLDLEQPSHRFKLMVINWGDVQKLLNTSKKMTWFNGRRII